MATSNKPMSLCSCICLTDRGEGGIATSALYEGISKCLSLYRNRIRVAYINRYYRKNLFRTKLVPWRWVLYQKPRLLSYSIIYQCFMETVFITALIWVIPRVFILSQINPLHETSCSSIHPRLILRSGFCPFKFPKKKLVFITFLFVCATCHTNRIFIVLIFQILFPKNIFYDAPFCVFNFLPPPLISFFFGPSIHLISLPWKQSQLIDIPLISETMFHAHTTLCKSYSYLC